MGSSGGFQRAGSGNEIDIASLSRRILWTFQMAVREGEMDRDSDHEDGLDVSDLNNNLRILACATRRILSGMSILVGGSSYNLCNQAIH